MSCISDSNMFMNIMSISHICIMGMLHIGEKLDSIYKLKLDQVFWKESMIIIMMIIIIIIINSDYNFFKLGLLCREVHIFLHINQAKLKKSVFFCPLSIKLDKNLGPFEGESYILEERAATDIQKLQSKTFKAYSKTDDKNINKSTYPSFPHFFL